MCQNALNSNKNTIKVKAKEITNTYKVEQRPYKSMLSVFSRRRKTVFSCPAV